MKSKTINLSWPASLSAFEQDVAHENFSRGKLKVFYQGETADHRYFSKAFAKELVQSLPYTPIVSYYDEETEDFVGHATEQQILGIVDPCIPCSFVEEDGVEWCVCDVVLYTERPDKVGELAKKIVGHKQSLELDPNSVEYTINYDERKHFKNIEFTAGRFVGLSVLGTDQKPAFTGSEFFSYDEEFEKKMKVLREYCEGKNDQTQHGGEDMNLQEFMKLSWGDISLKLEEAVNSEYCEDAYISIVDIFDDCIIGRFYFYMEGKTRLMRVNYECDSETGDVKLGDVKEVRIVYEDVNVVPTSTRVETDIEHEEVAAPIETVVEAPKASEEVSSDVKIEIVVSQAEVATELTSEDAGSSETYAEDNKEDENLCEEHSSESKEDSSDEDDSEAEMACGDDKPEDEDKENCAKSEDPDQKDADKEPDPSEQEDDEDKDFTDVDPAHVENVEITPEEKKVSVENEQSFNKQDSENSSSTSFTESERAELEALKREKKVTMVNSYKESLTEEDYTNFISNIDSYSEDKLELELLKKYKISQEQQSSSIKPMRAFTFAPVTEKNVDNPTDAFIRRQLKR